MNPISAKLNAIQYFNSSFSKNEESEPEKQTSDKMEFSDTSKAFAKLDSFLNLGKRDRLDISDLNESEKNEFLKMLAGLILIISPRDHLA